MIAQLDRFSPSQADRVPISKIFADKQLELINANHSEEESYELAKAWFIEHGHEMLQRMGISTEPKTDEEIKAAYDHAMNTQAKELRRLLGKGLEKKIYRDPLVHIRSGQKLSDLIMPQPKPGYESADEVPAVSEAELKKA
jgi:hypothetical protein